MGSILPDILFLKGRACTVARDLSSRALVGGRPRRWCHCTQPDASIDNVLAVVAQHPEKYVVRVGNLASRIPEHDADDVRLEHEPEMALALFQIDVCLFELHDERLSGFALLFQL